MGLDTSHGAWHGAYSAFYRWRCKIAETAKFPPLELMEGYYSEEGYNNPFLLLDMQHNKKDSAMLSINDIRKALPIKWDLFESHPLVPLLLHSDCDGEIPYEECKTIATALLHIIDKLPDEDAGGHIGLWKEKTKTFIDGCLLAYEKRENLEFH